MFAGMVKEKRDQRLYLRFTPAELAEIEEAARREGMDVSTWLRALGLKAARKGGR